MKESFEKNNNSRVSWDEGGKGKQRKAFLNGNL
jgi:hypothetical protein